MRPSLPLVGILFTAILAAAPRASLAQRPPETFSGRVVAVTDGDTLGVLRSGKEVKVRLHGIDAPESGQAFGATAKQFASEKTFGKIVTVRVTDTDRYGRLVGEVTLVGGTSLNEQLVKNGLAWWYHQYGAKERVLAEAEIDARAARRGLWADANPTPPWAFRHPDANRAAGEVAGRAVDPTPTQPSAPFRSASPAQPVPTPPTAPEPRASTVYLTRTGSKYHAAGCRSLRRSMIPVSLESARSQGYGPCSLCNP